MTVLTEIPQSQYSRPYGPRIGGLGRNSSSDHGGVPRPFLGRLLASEKTVPPKRSINSHVRGGIFASLLTYDDCDFILLCRKSRTKSEGTVTAVVQLLFSPVSDPDRMFWRCTWSMPLPVVPLESSVRSSATGLGGFSGFSSSSSSTGLRPGSTPPQLFGPSRSLTLLLNRQIPCVLSPSKIRELNSLASPNGNTESPDLCSPLNPKAISHQPSLGPGVGPDISHGTRC